MARLEASVPDVSCQHCVSRITKGLTGLAGVRSVKVDLQSKALLVDYVAPADEASIRGKLIEIGYPAQEPTNKARQ